MAMDGVVGSQENDNRVVDGPPMAWHGSQHCSRTIGRQTADHRGFEMRYRYSMRPNIATCHLLPPLATCHLSLARLQKYGTLQEQDCNPRPAQVRPGRALLQDCYNDIRLWCNGLHHQQEASTTVNQKGGYALPTSCPAWVAGGHRVVSLPFPLLPSWECRARVEDQDKACRHVEEVVVCRRGGCAVQDEPGSRRSLLTSKDHHPFSTKQHKQL